MMVPAFHKSRPLAIDTAYVRPPTMHKFRASGDVRSQPNDYSVLAEMYKLRPEDRRRWNDASPLFSLRCPREIPMQFREVIVRSAILP